jgi:hypothetical protein
MDYREMIKELATGMASLALPFPKLKQNPVEAALWEDDKKRECAKRLNVLRDADPEDVCKAFEHFGLFYTAELLEKVVCSPGIASNTPLLLGALTVGRPDLEWDEAHTTVETMPVTDRLRPHLLVRQPYLNEMTAALTALSEDPAQGPETIPYVDDYAYIHNTLTMPLSEVSKPSETAIRVLEYVLWQYENGASPPPNSQENIYMAGLMIMGSRLALGWDYLDTDCRHTFDRHSIVEHLKWARTGEMDEAHREKLGCTLLRLCTLANQPEASALNYPAVWTEEMYRNNYMSQLVEALEYEAPSDTDTLECDML